MTVVLSDQEIDRAEAFRLSKLLPLDESVVLNDDAKYHELESYLRLFGLSDNPVVMELLNNHLRKGMTSLLSGSDIAYVDRLSHVVDVERPVSFVDLRSVVDPGYVPLSRQGMEASNRAAGGRAAPG